MYDLTESQKQALRFIVKAIREGELDEEFVIIWTMQGARAASGSKTVVLPQVTRLNLDILQKYGLVHFIVDYETRSHFGGDHHSTHESHRQCCITPQGYRAVDADFSPATDIHLRRPPVEISESLQRFRSDFPDSNQVAFVMMQFGQSNAHGKILSGIRAALEPHGLTALRADDKQFHDDLYFNILTYIYGTRFGIAVFERLVSDDFNPNVSLEVGYMLGLGKSVCLLKDHTLRTLHTDLAGKLYRVFDPQSPATSIPHALFGWMEEKGFIARALSNDHGRTV